MTHKHTHIQGERHTHVTLTVHKWTNVCTRIQTYLLLLNIEKRNHVQTTVRPLSPSYHERIQTGRHGQVSLTRPLQTRLIPSLLSPSLFPAAAKDKCGYLQEFSDGRQDIHLCEEGGIKALPCSSCWCRLTDSWPTHPTTALGKDMNITM